MIKYLVVLIVLYSAKSFSYCEKNPSQYYLDGETCSDTELQLFANQADKMKVHDFCGFTKPCIDKNKSRVEIQNNETLLGKMIEQQIGQLFEEISSSNKDLDQELANGELKSCSLNQFDSFPENCKAKLKNHKIDSSKFQELFSSSLNGGQFTPKCMNGADSHFLLAVSEEKNWMRTIQNDKDILNDLLESKSDEAMLKILERKYSKMLSTNNPRLKVILRSRKSLKSYIDNNNSLSNENKKEWANNLESRCLTMFKSLEKFLCNKVPEGPFVISDYKYVKHFHADLNDDFNKDYCSKGKQELDLSEPFTEKAIYGMSPSHNDDIIRSNKDINKVICPLKVKCESDSNPINCLKNECTAYSYASKDQLKKNIIGQQQKKYCEDLFDFKNGGTIKNQELVNFLAEKKNTTVTINGIAVPTADSKLMTYFISPGSKEKITTIQVADKKINSADGDEAAAMNRTQITNPSIVGTNSTGTSKVIANDFTNKTKSETSTIKKQQDVKQDDSVDVTSYEKTIEAQNQLLDRFERAKKDQNTKKEDAVSATTTGKRDSPYVNNNPIVEDNKNKSDTNNVIDGNFGTAQGANTNALDGNSVKSKAGERNVSSNGSSTSLKDSTRVNSNIFGSNMDGTSLEHKNNIASSMDVNKEGQYKVTLKNLDHKTLNMELFKDEIKKQAKDAIDKGIPFVISIVNNDKEITINMIPKEKDGKITYIPTPKDESVESVAFAEKLKNSFYSQGKPTINEKNNRISVSDFEN